MNITKAFVEYMESKGFGTQGTNLYIGGVPANSPDASWWAIASGGSAIVKSVTGGKMKNYVIRVFYRDIDQEEVMNQLQAFEEEMNSGACDQLNGYDNIEIEASSYPADQDLEQENRTVGMVEVTVTTYSN